MEKEERFPDIIRKTIKNVINTKFSTKSKEQHWNFRRIEWFCMWWGFLPYEYLTFYAKV